MPARSGHRKTTPRVVGGRVQRKNNHTLTSTYWNTRPARTVVDKERPGPGYRHYLRKSDIERFISLLPDWEELSRGLDAILLAPGSPVEGWYDLGIVGICAWDRDPWIQVTPAYHRQHRDVLARLEVPCERTGKWMRLCFTDATVRAYQLLHVLLHELGHHHDRMTTTRRRRCGRGENYAEQYALRYEALIWNRYFEAFD